MAGDRGTPLSSGDREQRSAENGGYYDRENGGRGLLGLGSGGGRRQSQEGEDTRSYQIRVPDGIE